MGYGKFKKKDDGMSLGYTRINTYFITQGIHLGIKSHELATQENSPKR